MIIISTQMTDGQPYFGNGERYRSLSHAIRRAFEIIRAAENNSNDDVCVSIRDRDDFVVQLFSDSNVSVA